MVTKERKAPETRAERQEVLGRLDALLVEIGAALSESTDVQHEAHLAHVQLKAWSDGKD